MKYRILFAGLLPALTFAAGTLEVIWKAPDHYRDIQPANESVNRFRQRLFRTLETQLAQLTRKLPDGQRLELVFTNVDLAGEVRVGPRGSVRIIREGQPARLEFHYRLLDDKGGVLREGSEQLWGTLSPTSRPGGSEGKPFSVSRALLTRWFHNTLLRPAPMNKRDKTPPSPESAP
jgi:hypothetical protein